MLSLQHSSNPMKKVIARGAGALETRLDAEAFAEYRTSK